MRLDQFLSARTMYSRRELRQMIQKGKVTVDGAVVRKADQAVQPEAHTVCLNGREICGDQYLYVLLHKPKGYVSSADEAGQKSVLELVPPELCRKDLRPVGRLDKDTEGLLLITNDGALAHRLLSPVKHVPKTYLVHTKKPVTSQMCEKLEAGVEIGDETPTAPAKTKLLSDTDCGLLLTITEGRFHQVKRMLQAVGNEVVYLKRLSMGALVLDETLSKGSWRALTEEEKAQLGV